MAILFYYALLAAWPMLLWPALRLAGWSRGWLFVVAGAGLLAILHEVGTFYGTPSAIRLDIPLIAVALGLLYLTAVVVLFRGRWLKSAAVLGVVLVLCGGAMSYFWIEAGRESARLREIFRARDALLFQAKFRSLDAYASYFGSLDARSTLLPVGHWTAEGGGYFSRLIVNPKGRTWAFFPCGETECDYRSVDRGVRAVGDPGAGRWEVTLQPRAGLPVRIEMEQSGPDRLILRGRGQPTILTKAPPPVDPTPAREKLIYLGPFTAIECRGLHAEVRQLWLWREEQRLYAVGIFSTLVSGRHARFVEPFPLGEGDRQGASWAFECDATIDPGLP